MAAHKAVQVTVTVGTEVKGLKISEEGAEALWPNVPPQQIANRLLEGVTDAIREDVVLSVVGSVVDQWFNDNVSEID